MSDSRVTIQESFDESIIIKNQLFVLGDLTDNKKRIKILIISTVLLVFITSKIIVIIIYKYGIYRSALGHVMMNKPAQIIPVVRLRRGLDIAFYFRNNYLKLFSLTGPQRFSIIVAT